MFSRVFLGIGGFVEWYRGLGSLKVFWAKPVEEISVIGSDPPVLRVRWKVRRRSRDAVIGFPDSLSQVLDLCRFSSPVKIAVTSKDVRLPIERYDARSVVYLYGGGRMLRPNPEIEIRIYGGWDARLLDILQYIQKNSWGFFKEPVLGLHLVVLGILGGEAVASAYLNRQSFNVDYGVHVVRRYWRRRVGTRMLWETFNLARRLGSKYMSVVRVLRSRRGTAADRRAMLFYEANSPLCRLDVYRLRC